MSGRPLEVALGYVEEPDGSMLVAAGEPGAAWARNLEADARARATIGERPFDVIAEPLEGAPAAAAIVGLILKYGGTAERLGRGPVFRLRPAAQAPEPTA